MRLTNPLISLGLALALVAAPPAMSSLAYATENTGRTSLDSSRIRIDNFGRINPIYFRGEQPEGTDYADLAAMGVKTVIDLQADGDNDDEEQLVRESGMTFHRIPMTTRVIPTAAQIEEFLAIVNAPANQPVYVHCAGGRHRTGVMTAVYRMHHDGWTAGQAFKEMKQYKFGAEFLHPEFKQFVYAYEPPAATPATDTAAATQTN